MELPAKDTEVRVKNTPPIKLKDRPKRAYFAIQLKKQFGFIPEIIIIEKVQGANNTFVVRAIMTPKEIKKENRRKKELEKEKNKSKIILPVK